MERLSFKNVSDFIGMEYNAYIVVVNKEMAKEMLSSSIGNRTLNRENVKSLVRDMNNNDYHYKTPCSGIAFNTAGQLVNGHHTLTAFIESNLDVITLTLLTGTENLDKCDTGKTRTLKDSAVMSGNYAIKDVCKMGVNILRIRKGLPLTNSGAKKEFAYSEIFDFCNKNLDKMTELYGGIKAYKDRIRKRNEGIGKYPKSEEAILAALMWELIYDEGFNPELVRDFAYGIITINTHPNAIVDKFRKQVIKDSRLSNKNGAMTFNDFRLAFKDKFYKYAKSLTKKVA